jgi:hypothetical protein
MSGQISFGIQPPFFISIDWVLSNTLAADSNQVNKFGDECHSSTKAFIPPKKDVNLAIGH